MFDCLLAICRDKLFGYSGRGLGIETAEKQPPSAVEYACQFHLAIGVQKKAGKKLPFNQMMNAAITAYNSKVVVKRWKVEGLKKKICQNVLRCPSDFLEIVSWHYDRHKRAVSGTSSSLCEVDRRWLNCFLLCVMLIVSRSTDCKTILLNACISINLISWSGVQWYLFSREINLQDIS